MTLYIAIMDSEHYEWHGAGTTAKQARDALAVAFRRHLAGANPGIDAGD